MDLKSVVVFAAERSPDAPALVEGERRVSYGQLCERALAIAAALEDRGVRHGDRVALGMRNSIEHVLAFFALQALGAVAVPFNFRLKPASVAEILADAGVSLAIVDDPGLRAALPAHEGVPHAGAWIAAADPRPGAPSLAQLEREGAGRGPRADVRPDDLSVILYTSGTTGRPKGVPLTQRAAYHRAISYLLTVGLRFRSDVRTLGAAPLYHTVGLHYVMCVSMLLNGTYFPVRELDGRGLLDLVERERLSFLFGSPTLFHAMLRAAAEAPVDTGSVTHVSFGSAPMPPSQLAALAALFPAAEISEVYGTTEISIPFVTRDAVAAAPGALHPTADHRVRVIAPGGSPEDEVGVGRDGELLADVSNGGCFHGYWNQPATTAARVRDGWYHTGDMFRRESDGSFRISGRLDDMFISGAENIHPAEVEQALSGHPGIADVAVIGTPDERWGEVVTALVVRAHDRLTAEEIDRFCRQSALADFKRPRRILFVDAIERNASGKIVRREIRERAVRELVTGA